MLAIFLFRFESYPIFLNLLWPFTLLYFCESNVTMAATTAKNAKSADGKFADLQKDTVELNDKDHMTTDYGIKISDPDHWLRVASEKNTGPTLLEDQIAREKVRTLPYSICRVQSNN
jgi:hypothetical protein